LDEKEYLEIVDKSQQRRRGIHHKKTSDYATEDVLSNFKRVSEIIKILGVDTNTPHGMACVYIILKMDRFCNLVFRKSGLEPKNEAVEDTIDDWKNYLDLLEANWIEWKRTRTPTK
jgi:F0F1-type ATP synthase beta subunit